MPSLLRCYGYGVNLAAQDADLVAHGGGLGLVIGPAQHPPDEAGDLLHLRLAHAGGRDGGGADAQAAA